MKNINPTTSIDIRTAYTREGAWKEVRYITRDYEYDAETSEMTGIKTYRFTVTATKMENAGVILDYGNKIEVRIHFTSRCWEVLKIREIRIATESEIEDILDGLQRENENLKARIAELEAIH